MKFRIPFTISSDVEILKRRSKSFLKFTSPTKTKMDEQLKDSELDLTRRQYLSICYRSFALNLLVFSVIATSILGIFQRNFFYLYGLGIAILIAGFIIMNQLNYPRIFSTNKARDIEKNLISMLQDMTVQLNSGIPIFQILSSIADANYGEVSEEFKKITKEISSGIPQLDAIEKHGKLTNSKYFKRILWQISNGMRAGTDMNIVIRDSIKNLSEEQAIQIQKYGGRLNPLIMFYMLIAVILPALGITFMIIISSLINVEGKIIQALFLGAFGIIMFIQIMFLGIIRSNRPTLI